MRDWVEMMGRQLEVVRLHSGKPQVLRTGVPLFNTQGRSLRVKINGVKAANHCSCIRGPILVDKREVNIEWNFVNVKCVYLRLKSVATTTQTTTPNHNLTQH